MNVLVTGSAGFIGRNLVPKLTGRARQVYLIDRVAGAPVQGVRRAIRADLTDRKSLARAAAHLPRRIDACVFLAGQTDIRRSLIDPASDLQANALSVALLLSLVKVERFVYISTGSVYDGLRGMVSPARPVAPTIPYAVSKYAAELFVRSACLKTGNPRSYVILRLFNPYGPHDHPHRFIPRLVGTFGVRGEAAFSIAGSGRAIVDPLYVDDCTDAIVRAVRTKHACATVDICGGNPMTLIRAARSAAGACGVKPAITCAGASAEEIAFYADPRPQKTILGFSPKVTFEDGIRRYRAFLSAQPKDA